MGSPHPALPFPRGGSTVWPGIPVRAPPLLSGLREICAAKVRTGAGPPGGPPGRGKVAWLVGRVLTAEAASGCRAGPGDWLEAVPFWGQVGGPWWRRAVGLGWGHCPRPAPAEHCPQAGPAVRERARALASCGVGGAWPTRPLPPGRAPRTVPETAAEGLRRRTPGGRSLLEDGGGCSPPSQTLIKA